jgi:hypothetical protein
MFDSSEVVDGAVRPSLVLLEATSDVHPVLKKISIRIQRPSSESVASDRVNMIIPPGDGV